MRYDELFKVNADGIGSDITGHPCKFFVGEDDKMVYLAIHYDSYLNAKLYAPEEIDVSPILLQLLLLAPSRPFRYHKNFNTTTVVGEIVKDFYAKDMKDITVHTLNSSSCIEISAISEDDRQYTIRYSEQSKTYSFSMTNNWDGNTVTLDFSRELDLRFSQFVECFEG